MINYFAIGSMMNPVSLANRKIFPVKSQPAVLEEFALRFFPPMGFAEAVPKSAEEVDLSNSGIAEFHGVVHTVTAKEMDILDGVEGHLYRRRSAQAFLYNNGGSISVTVYCRKEEASPSGTTSLPQERYLDIMIEGARHFGVAESYIKQLQTLPKEPRPDPSDFLSFGIPPRDKIMTLDDIRLFDGIDGRPVYVTVNGKVLEILEKNPSKVGLTLSMRQKGHISFEAWVPQIVYDPKYGIPPTVEACPPEYSALMEHMAVQRIGRGGAQVVAKFQL